MNPSAWVEVQLALGGALRLAVGDRRGLGFFDVSLEGFWRSFRAAFICYPLYLALLAFGIEPAPWTTSGAATIFVVKTIAYVIAWVAFPLLMLSVSRWLGRESRFLPFMVAYNWAQVPQAVLLAVVGIDGATGLLPPAAAQFADQVATVAVLVYGWYVARVALAVPGLQALLVVVLDLALGTALARLAQALC